MNEEQIEVVLQANICSGCGNVWFTQHFEVEGEPQTCPYCKRNMLASAKNHIDLMPQNGIAIEPEIPQQIKDLMDSKTKTTLIQKQCKFCQNFIFVSSDDIETAKNCPYCSDVLIVWNPEETTATHPMHPDEITYLDDVKCCPVLIHFKDKRNGLLKLFKRNLKPIRGIHLGLCPISKLVRVLIEEKSEVRWYELSEIKSITEIISPEMN